MKIFKILIFTAIIFLFQSINAEAATRYVKQGGTGNGTSWAAASGDLQAVINASADGDQIWVAAGTYKPNRPANNLSTIDANNRDNAFVLKKGVKIYGGFPAAGSGNALTDRDWNINKSTLSGDIGTANDNADNCYHVLIGAGDVGSACLDGFTISGGNANGGNSYISVNGQGIYRGYGGGMFNNSSSPTLSNCTFSGNSASDGGGMYNENSSPKLYNCTFSGNNAFLYGGGMRNWDNSSPKLYNCIVLGNNSGIANEVNSNPDIQYSLVQDESSTANGNINATGITPADVFTNWIDPTATGWTATSTGDYTLKAGSPAINKGDNTKYNLATMGNKDLAGKPRIFGGTIDLGAYERQKEIQTISVEDITKHIGDADFTAGSVSTGLPLTYSSADPAVAEITSGGSIHITGAGVSLITVTQAGNDEYESASATFYLKVLGLAPFSVSYYDWSGSAMRPNAKIDVRLSIVNRYTNQPIGSGLTQELPNVSTNSFGLFSVTFNPQSWLNSSLASLVSGLHNAAVLIETKEHTTPSVSAYRIIGALTLSSLIKSGCTFAESDAVVRSEINRGRIAQLRWYDINRLGLKYDAGAYPLGICYDGHYIRTVNKNDNNVCKLDPRTGAKVGADIGVVNAPYNICFDGKNLWVAGEGGISKVDATAGTAVNIATVSGAVHICFDGKNIWASSVTQSKIYKINAVTNDVTSYNLSSPSGLCFDGHNLWAAHSNNISKIDTADGTLLGTYPVGNSPNGICFDGENIWTANIGDGTVTKIKAAGGVKIGTYPAGEGAWQLTFDGYNIWVTGDAGVTKLNARTGAVIDKYLLGSSSPSYICFDGVNIWVTLRGENKVIKL